MIFRQFAALLLALTLGFAPSPALAVLKGVAAAPGLQNAASVAITGGTITGVNGTPYVLGQFSIPMISVATGSMANNGVITVGTALGRTYAKCYMFLPAGAIAAGVPAAATWYYTEMSSTTAGIVYNNIYTTGIPTVPASKTSFVTTGPGAYTGDTSEQGVTISVAANLFGSYGGFYSWATSSNNNTAGTKILRIRYSGSGGTVIGAVSATTSLANAVRGHSFNAGATNSQIMAAELGGTGGVILGATAAGAIDTTAATTVFISMQKNTATDNGVIEAAYVQVMTNGS